ncbi:MAG: DUF4861 domain-containing protein [Bacteroidetes bacterium]|nr:MAG: DUF4861 domain-containing protein [Bacteroidota bacterium]
MNIKISLGIFLFVLSLHAQQLTVTVTNPASFDRALETIEVPWSEVQTALSLAEPSTVMVFENDKQLVCQALDSNGDKTPDLLLFQATFKQGEEKKFVVKQHGVQKEAEVVSIAKFMVPREDVAWENDRIAYRIYGSKLAGDVYSGLDVLVKRVRYPVLEKWYEMNTWEGDKKVSYHEDHGEGADFFTVGKTLGGGGCALWRNDSMYISGLFTSHKIVASGPVRAMFSVTYTNSLNGKPFTEEKTYTLDAGQNFNRIEVKYSGLENEGAEQVAVGLVKRKNTSFYSDEKQGWFSLCGLANDDSLNGNLETGVVLQPALFQTMKETDAHYLMIAATSPDKRLTYYAGGGWTRSGDFPTDDGWLAYVSQFSHRLKYPLVITTMK